MTLVLVVYIILINCL